MYFDYYVQLTDENYTYKFNKGIFILNAYLKL